MTRGSRHSTGSGACCAACSGPPGTVNVSEERRATTAAMADITIWDADGRLTHEADRRESYAQPSEHVRYSARL